MEAIIRDFVAERSDSRFPPVRFAALRVCATINKVTWRERDFGFFLVFFFFSFMVQV